MASVPDTFGRSRVTYGREECVALPPAPGTEIDSGRKDDEDDLCKIKFDDPNVIFCPALHSTNPGTDIYELPTGVSRESFEQKECAKEMGRNADFLAKFKQSTSCSYTPAILAYGKLADALKIHVDVPATVYRTMELATHKGVEKMAAVYAHGLIKQTWAGLVSKIAASSSKVIKDGLLYGAMVDHKGGIDHHPTLNHRGPDSNPAAPFLASSTWAMATNGSELRNQIPPSLETLGQMMAVRDVGEMAIIDHILAQQDRFGNVAKKDKIFWLEQTDAGQKLRSVKATKANKPIDGTNQTTMDYLNANHIPYVQFPVMVLADNDCGLRQDSNVVRKNNMVQHLRHISSSVYKRVQSFAKTNPDNLLQYFQTQTLMTSDEAKGVIARLQEVASILKNNCDNGTLLFDAKPEIFLGMAALESGTVISPSSPAISGSVGRWEKNASNVPEDVQTVQRLLQTAAQKLQAPQVDPKGVDGKISRPPKNSNTVNAIEAFQSRSNIPVDGLIEPQSQAWQALLQAAGGN